MMDGSEKTPPEASSSGMIVEHGVVAGNVYDKYGTRNPVARRLMKGFLDAVDVLVQRAGCDDIHEVGCGEGKLAIHLAGTGRRVRASDFSEQVIARARENGQAAGVDVAFKAKSIYDLSPDEDRAGLVVCSEVLEHLEAPDRALAVLSRLASPYLLASVPREPIWRILNMMRGHFHDTPGHLQHWSRTAFVAFLSQSMDVVLVRSPLPWTLALCRRRG